MDYFTLVKYPSFCAHFRRNIDAALVYPNRPLKEMRNSYFCVTPKNHWNILKRIVTKKVIVCFYDLGEENF